MGRGLVGQWFIFGGDLGDEEWGPWKGKTGERGDLMPESVLELPLLPEYPRERCASHPGIVPWCAVARGTRARWCPFLVVPGLPAKSLPFPGCTCASTRAPAAPRAAATDSPQETAGGVAGSGGRGRPGSVATTTAKTVDSQPTRPGRKR